MKKSILIAIAMLVAAMTNSSQGAMRITEWMYSGINGEYVEFTNTGAAAIDMTGWSYDDDSRVPGTTSLGAFGILTPGESAILTESVEAAFRAAWSLAPTVKVIGSNTNNLGRNDEINLFDSSSALVDRLTYGDQNIPGTIRTTSVSGNPITLAALGTNNVAQWQLSFVGDAYGSYYSAGTAPFVDLGNPGIGNYVVPEPSSVVLGLFGAAGVAAIVIRRRRIG